MSHGCSDYGRNFTDVLTQLRFFFFFCKPATRVPLLKCTDHDEGLTPWLWFSSCVRPSFWVSVVCFGDAFKDAHREGETVSTKQASCLLAFSLLRGQRGGLAIVWSGCRGRVEGRNCCRGCTSHHVHSLLSVRGSLLETHASGNTKHGPKHKIQHTEGWFVGAASGDYYSLQSHRCTKTILIILEHSKNVSLPPPPRSVKTLMWHFKSLNWTRSNGGMLNEARPVSPLTRCQCVYTLGSSY